MILRQMESIGHYPPSEKWRLSKMGLKMKAYRADKRRFLLGQTIFGASEFPMLHPNGIEVEKILEDARPATKPVRKSSLFLFENKMHAERHWAKMSGGILYECEIDPYSILHKGDMRLVDKVMDDITTGGNAKITADLYWSGAPTDDPIFELLLVQATIERVICDDQNKRRLRLIKGYSIFPEA